VDLFFPPCAWLRLGALVLCGPGAGASPSPHRAGLRGLNSLTPYLASRDWPVLIQVHVLPRAGSKSLCAALACLDAVGLTVPFWARFRHL